MSEFIIKADDLCKNYGKKAAIDSFTLNIPGGGIIGLIGRNGSGKTTFMKLCAGQLDVTAGELTVFDGVPMDNLDVLSDVVYSFHNIAYDKQLRLQAILSNYAVMYKEFDSEFAGKLLKYFDLLPKLKYKHLSQGMVSLFNFICGLSCRSKLTMFDEPVLGMDVTVRKAVYEVLLRDYAEHPRTIIISSHLLSELEGILSDILLIAEGKPVLFDNIDNLRQGAYRVEGEKAVVDAFSAGKQIIYYKNGISCEAVIKETIDDASQSQAQQHGLRISNVRPEDLCVYLTRENKEGELECLWQKVN
jgi:ABC-2 type transport system ATP-binding protein